MPGTPMPWTDEEDDIQGAITASPPKTTTNTSSAPDTKNGHPYGDNKYNAGSADVLNRLGAKKPYGE